MLQYLKYLECNTYNWKQNPIKHDIKSCFELYLHEHNFYENVNLPWFTFLFNCWEASPEVCARRCDCHFNITVPLVQMNDKCCLWNCLFKPVEGTEHMHMCAHDQDGTTSSFWARQAPAQYITALSFLYCGYTGEFLTGFLFHIHSHSVGSCRLSLLCESCCASSIHYR